MRTVLDGRRTPASAVAPIQARCEWVGSVLDRLRYGERNRADRGLVLNHLRRLGIFSLAHVTRLAHRHHRVHKRAFACRFSGHHRRHSGPIRRHRWPNSRPRSRALRRTPPSSAIDSRYRADIQRLLIAQLPELGKLDRRLIVALAGGAVIACDSGLRPGQRRVQGGRFEIRSVAVRGHAHSSPATPPSKRSSMPQRRRKLSKVALVACMRKLRTMLNAP